MSTAAPHYTPEFCERQYNNRAAVPEHPQIFARWQALSAQTREAARCELDLEYGTAQLEKLDLFLPEGAARALLVFIHGGYWRSLDKSDFSFLAPVFTQRGVAVAVPNYSLCPQVRIDDIVQQMRAAIAWLWRHAHRYAIDRTKLCVAGHSAGGHLAAMLAATHWPSYATYLPTEVLLGVIPISGLYDLEPLRYASMNLELKLDQAAAQRLSPIRFTPAARMPISMAVGGAETDEFRRQNQLLIEAWGAACPMQDIPLPGFNHFTVVEQLAEPASALHRAALAMLL